VERLLRWEEKATDPELKGWLASAAPRSSDTAELLVAHRMEASGWQPTGLWLKTENPFENQVACGTWVAEFLSRCNGERSSMELLESMKGEGIVPTDAPVEEFVEMVRGLASGGYVEFDGF
jgi:hypothetical protein